MYTKILLFFCCSFTAVYGQEIEPIREIEKKPEVEIHHIDAEEEGFSVKEIIEIHQETPVVALTVDKNWQQEDFDQLAQIDGLTHVLFIDTDLRESNIDFISKKRSVLELRFKNCQLNQDIFKIIRRTPVKKMAFMDCKMDKEHISNLSKSSRLKIITTNQDLSQYKKKLKDIIILQKTD